MKDPDKDKTQGKADQILGKIKETAGKAFGNKQMETEGKAQQAKGDATETKGRVKDKVADSLDGDDSGNHDTDKDSHAGHDHSTR